jgi:hypothetical protein
MKYFNLFLFVIFILTSSCDKVTVEITNPPLAVHHRDVKPDTPVPLGSIRGYFGDYYMTFNQHIEKVQPVDSFSNAYFYGNCDLHQINLIRCDSDFVLAIYINGYALESLPDSLPVPSEYGKNYSLEFYPFKDWNYGTPSHYSMGNFYGKDLIITDRTDDILTGTFSGILSTSSGQTLPVTEGEFKIKIFRKYMPCGK